MPRVKGFTRGQKMNYQMQLLTERCEEVMAINKINKSDVARFIGVTPQAVHSQFKRNAVSPEAIMAIVTMAKKLDAENLRKMFLVK